MAKVSGVTRRHATEHARRELGRPIVSRGFDTRQYGSHTINVHYFSVKYDEKELNDPIVAYRIQVFVDGKVSAGVIC